MSRNYEREFVSWFQTFALFWMLYAFFWVIPRRLNVICRRFGTLCLFHLHRWVGAYEDGTECSEKSVYKIQTPGNYPEEKRTTKPEFSRQIFEKYSNVRFHEDLSSGKRVFFKRADVQLDIHGEANSQFSAFCESSWQLTPGAPKWRGTKFQYRTPNLL